MTVKYNVFVFDPYWDGERKYKQIISEHNMFNLVYDIENADIAISYGGDGTLLEMVSMLYQSGDISTTLVAGLNKGTVGFMANDMNEIDFIDRVLNTIYNDKYVTERTLFQVYTDNKLNTLSLNEISIHPVKRGKLFVCDVCVSIPSMDIKDEHITYKGDGIIVSTSSGSTAYNLSTGGPILTPCSGRVIISPICPFSLADRSIVLPSDTEVVITPESEAEVVVDGTSKCITLRKISVKSHHDKLLLYKRDNFLKTIQEKLGWNHSIK